MSKEEAPKINLSQAAETEDPQLNPKIVKAIYVVAQGINAGLDVALAPIILSSIVLTGEHPLTGEEVSKKERVKAAAELAASAIPVKPIRAALKVADAINVARKTYKASRETP